MGSSRRLVLKASRARVIAFSSASNAWRASSHSSRVTTLGRVIVSSSRWPGSRPRVGSTDQLSHVGPRRETGAVDVGTTFPSAGPARRETATPTVAPGEGPDQAVVLCATGLCAVRTTPPATSSVTAKALDGRGGIDRERHVARPASEQAQRHGPTVHHSPQLIRPVSSEPRETGIDGEGGAVGEDHEHCGLAARPGRRAWGRTGGRGRQGHPPSARVQERGLHRLGQSRLLARPGQLSHPLVESSHLDRQQDGDDRDGGGHRSHPRPCPPSSRRHGRAQRRSRRRREVQGGGTSGPGPSVDLRRDAVPDLRRGVHPHVGDEAGHLPVLGDLGRAPGALEQVRPDGVGFLGLHRVEGERAERLRDLVVAHGSVHAASTPC